MPSQATESALSWVLSPLLLLMKAQQIRMGPSDLTDISISVFAGLKFMLLSNCEVTLICVDDSKSQAFPLQILHAH